MKTIETTAIVTPEGMMTFRCSRFAPFISILPLEARARSSTSAAIAALARPSGAALRRSCTPFFLPSSNQGCAPCHGTGVKRLNWPGTTLGA